MKIKQVYDHVIDGRDIPYGTVFEANHPSDPTCRHVFLRTAMGVVSLTDPHDTWTPSLHGAYDMPKFRDYLPLDVELIIHGPARGDSPSPLSAPAGRT